MTTDKSLCEHKLTEPMGASSRETNKVITFGSADKYKHFFNNNLLVFQNEEKGKRAEELIIANNELVFQNREKEKRAAESNLKWPGLGC